MDYFRYVKGELLCEDVPVADIAAKFGTPTYIYSRRTIVEHFKRIQEAFSQVETLDRKSVV